MSERPPIHTLDEPLDDSGADEVVERLKKNNEASQATLPDAAKLALKMKGLGFAVMPLPTNAKSPPVGKWEQARTANPAVFLTNPGTHNYAVQPPPGCFGLDVDKDAPSLLEKVTASLGVTLPDTLMTFSPNGRHQYYRWPTDLARPKGQMFGSIVTRWPAEEGGQGYFVGPGSVVVQENGSLAPYIPYGLDEPDAIADFPRAWAEAALNYKPAREATVPTGVLAEVTPHYELPDHGYTGSRYYAIRDYVAHLWNRGLTDVEMFGMVVTQLAPRFADPLSEADLHERFARTIEDIDVRLGERKSLPEATLAPSRVEAPEPASSVAPDVNTSSPLFVALAPFIADLSSRDPIGYLVDGWVPASGLTMWAGHPKSMKSMALLQLLGAFVAGGEWLGKETDSDDTRVGLYLTKEGSTSEMLKRVETLHDRHGADLGDRLRFAYEQPIVFDPASYLLVAQALADIEAEYSITGKTLRVMLVLDPMRDLMTGGADENEAKTIGLVKTWCRTLMADYRFLSIVLVHHLRKSAEGSTGLEMSGSGAVYGATDSTVIWKAKKETIEDDDILVTVAEMYGSYRVESRGDAPFSGKWRYDNSTRLIVPGVKRIETSSGRAVAGTAKASLMEMLVGAGTFGATVEELALTCEVSDSNVRAQLSRMNAQGRVIKEGGRWYAHGRAPHQQADVILPVESPEDDGEWIDPMHALS